jgi:hypothetical protein
MKATDHFLPARYRDAQQALAEVRRVDEVKSIRDKAKALQAYAYEAKDRTLIETATEIRLRAEIRAGELLTEMKIKGERDGGRGGDRRSRFHAGTVKLEMLGVTKKQSANWQALAALPAEEQEAKIVRAKSRAVVKITTPRKKSSERNAIERCVATARAAIAAALKIADTDKLFTAVRAEIDAVAAARGHDCGATSASEAAHKDAYIEQLEHRVRQQELTIAGLRRDEPSQEGRHLRQAVDQARHHGQARRDQRPGAEAEGSEEGPTGLTPN